MQRSAPAHDGFQQFGSLSTFVGRERELGAFALLMRMSATVGVECC